jgi:hypothetical protein
MMAAASIGGDSGGLTAVRKRRWPIRRIARSCAPNQEAEAYEDREDDDGDKGRAPSCRLLGALHFLHCSPHSRPMERVSPRVIILILHGRSGIYRGHDCENGATFGKRRNARLTNG